MYVPDWIGTKCRLVWLNLSIRDNAYSSSGSGARSVLSSRS